MYVVMKKDHMVVEAVRMSQRLPVVAPFTHDLTHSVVLSCDVSGHCRTVYLALRGV